VFCWKFLRAIQGHYEIEFDFMKEINDNDFAEKVAYRIYKMKPKKVIQKVEPK